MLPEVNKKEIYDLGMTVLAIVVVFVLLLNFLILFDLF